MSDAQTDNSTITTAPTNDEIIENHGMLYYLYNWTDFLANLPDWMHEEIQRELKEVA